jgi:hypothetical protein
MLVLGEEKQEEPVQPVTPKWATAQRTLVGKG